MKYSISIFLIMICLPTYTLASPFWLSILHDMENGTLNGYFTCSSCVDTHPVNPTQSYAVFEAPALDGSQGLNMIQVGSDNPPHLGLSVYCKLCMAGNFLFDVAASPGMEFGHLQVIVNLWGGEISIYEFDAPGQYSLDFPSGFQLYDIMWAGNDIVIDNFAFETMCDCYVPNEERSWGAVKAVY